MIFRKGKKGVFIALVSCMVAVVLGFITFTIVAVAAANTSFVRGMYGSDAPGTLWDKFQSLGFNAVNVGASKADLDNLAARNMRGLVWLGDYNKSTCVFDSDDNTITQLVKAIAGHPAILVYYLADEPEQALQGCPNVASQMKARSDLVKSLDPSKPTYTVVSNSAFVAGGTIEFYPYQYFAGKTDIMGLDIYPCRWSLTACAFNEIDEAITAANSKGVTHYWAILQDFQDATWRYPTTTELQTEFDRWAKSRMEGYFIFSWNWSGNSLDSRGLSTLHNQSSAVELPALHGAKEAEKK